MLQANYSSGRRRSCSDSIAILGGSITFDQQTRQATGHNVSDRKPIITITPAVLRTRAVAALRANVLDLLPSVQVPVLQLVGSQDRLLAPSASTTLSAGLPSCRTVAIPGPHLLLQTATRACAEEVAAFALGFGLADPQRTYRQDHPPRPKD